MNEAEGLKACNPYIVREFSYMEYLLESLHIEMLRLKNAELDREWFVAEWEPEEYKLIDYTTGSRKDIKMLSRKEYEEYVNRRAGHKIY